MNDCLRRYAKLFRHSSWANALLARAVSEQALDPRATRILAHLHATDWLWLRRLGADGPDVSVWPQWAPAESAAQGEELGAAWRSFLEPLDAAGLTRTIHYTNTRGEPWSSVVEDVLDHVLLHGSHHRGQLVLLLREAGMEPPLVDFAHAVRSGLLDS